MSNDKATKTLLRALRKCAETCSCGCVPDEWFHEASFVCDEDHGHYASCTMAIATRALDRFESLKGGAK